MENRIISIISDKYKSVQGFLDEHSKRIWAAAEAQSLGRGGINAVRAATGMGYWTLRKGLEELADPSMNVVRIRKSGGGRKKKIETDKTLLEDLQLIVAPATRGNPMNPLLWTSKSLSKIVNGLKEQGHEVGITTVRKLLKQLGYSLQSNRKRREGENHPDRNAQFEYINEHVKKRIAQDEPVISVDTKKKENLGNYSNKGQEYQPKGQPVETNMHDFPDKNKGKAIPYGIYDMVNNMGFVTIGIDHDTAEFAVHSIRTWWKEMGKKRFPKATSLTITADCGGSNSYRTKLWKVELQHLADEFGLDIIVHHFPPGTSKWNQVEHRLFSYISKNWRGRPLIDLVTVVNLIANTKTESGLKVRCIEDKNLYEKGIKITNNELKKINIKPQTFHPEWNYTIETKNKNK
jgi:transposase